MEENQPLLSIEGTEFLFDIDRLALIEKENPQNAICLQSMRNHGTHYSFDYSCANKNIHSISGIKDLKGILSRILESAKNHDPPLHITIPRISVLDPVGMRRNYHCTERDLTNKTDDQIMKHKKDKLQDAVERRINKGILPTIEVAGHLFYVDLRMDKLRPKDDFFSNGIVFNDIDAYYNEEKQRYMIPYDPSRKEFREIDYETITAIPKDLIVVSFPAQEKLDPLGWNRKHGFDLADDLPKGGIQFHFKAKTVTWDEIYVPQKIKENINKEQKQTYSKGRKI